MPGKAEPVQPDLVFVAAERLDIVTQRAIEGVPDLVVEVLSPSNWLDDRRTKFALYAEIGVREYWIVDPDERTVEVFSLQEGRYALRGRFGPDETLRSDLLPGFEVAVGDLFPR
jgi:Uma2 family endonuclease